MEDLELDENLKEMVKEFKEKVKENYEKAKNKQLSFDTKEFNEINDKKTSSSYLDKFARRFVWSEDLKISLYQLNKKVRKLWDDANVIKKRISPFYKMVIYFYFIYFYFIYLYFKFF